MSPRSPIAGFAATLASLGEYCRSITESLAKVRPPALNVRVWAENRLDQAMRCPECGHGGELDPELAEEHADGCECTDPLCACNPEAVDFGEPPR
jgi:hypothetical protein